MELKYTSGPWEKDHGMSEGHIKSISKNENDNYTPTVCRYKNLYAGDFTVADILTTEEQEANGLLIAAAPEMLEALIDVCKRFPMVDDEVEFKMSSSEFRESKYLSKNKFHAIIEKATGLKIEEILKDK
jgi:hypothetical protein